MKRTSSEVISIGVQSNDDLQLEPYEGLTHVLARLPKRWSPSFYHCYQVESNLMPVGLEEASFPILGYASDYDTRIQTCLYRAQGCDAMVVTGEVDHHEMRRGFGLPCVVFPKAIGVWAEAFERADLSCKDVDVFCSGTPMSFYQVDKGRLVYRLMQLSDRYRVRIHRGYLAPEQYVTDTCRAKIVFSFVRRQPVWSSRAADALAGGAVVLYQEGGGLDLFFSESEGAVPYREENLESVVERILSRWNDTYARAALRGRARALREFDLRVCMERYLKRLAILGTEVSRSARARRSGRREVSLRYPPFARGGFVVSPEKRKAVWTVAFQETIRRLDEVPPDKRSANEFNILAFSRFLLGYRKWKPDAKSDMRSAPPEAVRHLHEAWHTFEDGATRFPDHLILLFNWGRVGCVLRRRQEAYEIFGSILAKTSITLNPCDDLFGDDFADRHLPFRAYIDGLMRHIVTKDPKDLRLLGRILIASVWWYRGLLEYEQGSRAASIRSLKECLSRFSAHPPYHDFYGDVPLLHEGAGARWTDGLVDHLSLAWTLAPYNPGILRRLIIGLEKVGRRNEAAVCRDRYARIADSLEGGQVLPLPTETIRGRKGAVGAATLGE